ncbi:MAG: transporter family protein [Devosia sp.]|jgi:capsular polysaccharide transport system ATP-binding protein|nr:transporter family protein [Devosia sp.]
MIRLENVHKSYPTKSGRKVILREFSGAFENSRNVGILGHNGAGKSTLFRLLSGAEAPDRGRIIREGRVSWPLGFSGGFHNSLTGRENVRFICQIYGASYREVLSFVEDFAAIGRFMDMPVKSYSSGMKARLAFGISMALNFDYYLIDEVVAVGDAAFKKKSKTVLSERLKSSSVLLVSHSAQLLKEFCDVGGVLHNGELVFYPTIDEAIAVHEANQNATI